MRWFIGALGWFFSIGFALLIVSVIAGVIVFNHYNRDLPDYEQLAQYEPPTVTRLYAADGRLMAEYATEKRVFVPLTAIPKLVRQAFLSAEDKNFYEHSGIDFTGIARAVRDNIIFYGQGKSLVGGSTITQQVVKNFLLSNEKSFERKIKEAILATRISEVYSKDKILELYLNQIFLGGGSYGVAAAALNYFDKSLDDLTIEEAALLAALPKAPSTYNPRRNEKIAKERRDWVISRMLEDGAINNKEAEQALATPIILKERAAAKVVKADFFSEEVRRWLSARYGSKVLYEGGLVVKTTLNPELQEIADRALRKALVDYDRRRGYRGPIARLESMDSWKEKLAVLEKEHNYHVFSGQRLAVATELKDAYAQIAFANGDTGKIPLSLMKWTRLVLADGVLGPIVNKPSDIIKIGDVLLVGELSSEQKKLLKKGEEKGVFDLQQIPEVNGALVVLDPNTGRILAMSGGYAYGGSEFNRVTQAKRQPGSVLKPFVYLAALENGFTPSTMVMDAPVEIDQGPGLPVWRPQNYADEYLGPITLREGLEKSRNTITVRLAQMIGIDKVVEITKRLGIYDDPKPHFSMVLGAVETTLFRMANAYGMIVNGGKQITPTFIERIENRHGTIIYRRDNRHCDGCMFESVDAIPADAVPPLPQDIREQMIDPRVAYQLTSILEGVTVRGTAARAHAQLKRPLAGKTGTTNDSRDTWFVGFSPDLVAGVYIGYDAPKTLGRRETGSSVALPAFIQFADEALKDTPTTPFRIPPGIMLTRVDMATGLPVDESNAPLGKVVMESFVTGDPIFIPGNISTDTEQNISDGGHSDTTTPLPYEKLPTYGTGGLY